MIPKADKPSYNVVKAWRMIHLLPTLAKVAERIVLMRVAKQLELEPTQFGSRTGRGVHDAMALIFEFLEHNEGMEVAMPTMDVEGGFDKIDVGLLCDFMMAKGCNETLCAWVRRWARCHKVAFRFNGRISKVYHTSKGLPQGSPLSPFLFRAYVADIMRPRMIYTPSMRRIVSSYVDDEVVLVAADTRDCARDMLVDTYRDCCRVASGRGMGFSVLKTKWIGFGGKWDALEWDGHVSEPVEDLRVLGFRFNMYANFTAHVDYWLKRGLGVRARIGALGRRFGGVGGLGAWETLRLIQSIYLPLCITALNS